MKTLLDTYINIHEGVEPVGVTELESLKRLVQSGQINGLKIQTHYGNKNLTIRELWNDAGVLTISVEDISEETEESAIQATSIVPDPESREQTGAL